MADSEKKKKAKTGKISPTGRNRTPSADEFELMTDEDQLAVRHRKSSSNRQTKKKSRKKSRASRLFDKRSVLNSENIWDILTASKDDGPVKPLQVFGMKIKFWPIILIIAFVMMIIMIVITNGNVEVLNDNVTVVGLPSDLENYTILVVSDMNGKRFGDGQSSLLRTINNTSYDMLLCVGDMVGESGDPEPFYEFLEGLNKPGKCYFTYGDSDPGPYLDVPRDTEGTLRDMILEDWILGAIERGAHYVDTPIDIPFGDHSLWLTPVDFFNVEAVEYRADWLDQMRQEESGVVSGLASDYNSLPMTSYRYALAKEFYSAIGRIKSDDLVIALSHIVPDDEFISSISIHAGDTEGKYLSVPELIVSGHYCGGVWHMPGGSAFYVPNTLLPNEGWFPDPEDVSGLSQVGECQVYITGGLSTTSAIPALPFRLLNPPEVTLLHFSAKLPDSLLDE